MIGFGRTVSGAGTHLLDRIDARTRVLLVLSGVGIILFLDSAGLLAAAALYSALLGLGGGMTWRQLLGRAMAVGFVLSMLMLSLALSTPGDPWLDTAIGSVSNEGLLAAAALWLRVIAILWLVLGVLGSLEPARLAAALRALGLAPRLSLLLLLTLRQVSCVGAELHRLLRAMHIRGFQPSVSRHALVSLGELIGLVIVRSLDRGQRTYAAMRCRGFSGDMPGVREALDLKDLWQAVLLVLPYVVLLGVR